MDTSGRITDLVVVSLCVYGPALTDGRHDRGFADPAHHRASGAAQRAGRRPDLSQGHDNPGGGFVAGVCSLPPAPCICAYGLRGAARVPVVSACR
jgi:hypothetical protein